MNYDHLFDGPSVAQSCDRDALRSIENRLNQHGN